MQALLSLRLVWSNTAFGDEANYLWGGHLEVSHWLHGTPVPTTIASTYSGSPLVYPPMAAMVDPTGGLAAARILSLCFMLGATVLLYVTASKVFNRTVAGVVVRALGRRASRLSGWALLLHTMPLPFS